jgi:hypothetical protein
MEGSILKTITVGIVLLIETKVATVMIFLDFGNYLYTLIQIQIANLQIIPVTVYSLVQVFTFQTSFSQYLTMVPND